MKIPDSRTHLFLLLVILIGIIPLTCRAAALLAADEQSIVYRGDAYSVAALTPTGRQWSTPTFAVPTELVLTGNLLFFPYVACDYLDQGCRHFAALSVFDKSTGKLKWSYRSSVEGGATPIQTDLQGYVHYDGHLFNPADGTVLPDSTSHYYESADGFDLPSPAPNRSSYSIGNDGTYYEVVDDLVIARDHFTGATNWTSRVIQGATEPIIAEDGSVLVGDLSGTFYALDQFTGEKLWQMVGQVNFLSSAVALTGNRVAIVRLHTDVLPDRILVLNVSDGSLVSSYVLKGEISQDSPFIILPNGTLYIDGTDGNNPIWLKGGFKYGDSVWPKNNSKNSNIRSLARLGAPTILSQPQPALLANNSARFSVYAGGTTPLFFQWFKNGEPITDTTNGFYLPTAPQFTDSFSVQVSNTVNSVLSTAATPGYSVNTFTEGAHITINPRLSAYSPGSSITLTATPWADRPFVGWQGTTNSSSNPLVLTVNSDFQLFAAFAHHQLDLLGHHPVGKPASFPTILPGPSNSLFVPVLRQAVALDLAHGHELWRSEPTLEQITQASLSPNGDMVLVDANTLYVIDSATGQTKWSRQVLARSMAIDPLGNIFSLGGSLGGKLNAFSPVGSLLWSRADINSPLPGFIGPNGILYLSDGASVHAIERASGNTLWRTTGTVAYPAPFNCLVTHHHMPNYSTTWPLYAVDANSGTLLAFRKRLPDWSQTFPMVRVSDHAQLLIGPSGIYESWVEWNLNDNSLVHIGHLAPFGSIVTDHEKILMQGSNGQLSLHDLRTRAEEAAEDQAPAAYYPPVWPSLTLLPDGRAALLTDPGFLDIYYTTQRLAQTVSPNETLNAQGTRSLLRYGPPFIYTQPANQLFISGSSASFAVDATGTPPLSFQWYRNDQPIDGTHGPELNLASLLPEDLDADFKVEISNDQGSVLSHSAALGYTVKVLVDGHGHIEPDLATEIISPRQPITIRAIPENRTFLGWSGSFESTNQSLSFTVSSNLVIRAHFDFLPGDLLWEAPLAVEVEMPTSSTFEPPNLTVHASSDFPELFLPGLVRFDLRDRSAVPLLGAGQWTNPTGQRGENVFSAGPLGSSNMLMHYQFGSSLRQIPFIQLDIPLTIDAETNLYSAARTLPTTGADGYTSLLKFNPDGGIIWSNRLSPYFYTPNADLRIADENHGFLWRPWSDSDFLVFDTTTGAVLVRSNILRTLCIPLPKLQFTSSISDPQGHNPLAALDLLSQKALWTNYNSGSIYLVSDDRRLFTGGGKAINLSNGLTLWTTDLGVPQSLVLAADHKLYFQDGTIKCINSTNGIMEWSVEPRNPSYYFTGPLCLSPDGTLYCLTWDHTLVAYKASAGLADSSWPEPNGKGNSFAFTPSPPLVATTLTVEPSTNGFSVSFPTQSNATYSDCQKRFPIKVLGKFFLVQQRHFCLNMSVALAGALSQSGKRHAGRTPSGDGCGAQ